MPEATKSILQRPKTSFALVASNENGLHCASNYSHVNFEAVTNFNTEDKTWSALKVVYPLQFSRKTTSGPRRPSTFQTSSYPGWIKSPHVVTLGILKLSDVDYLTIFIGGGFRSKLWSSQI